MKKIIFLFLMLLPIITNAECTVSIEGNLMTLHVNNSKNCLNTVEEKEAFKSTINIAMKTIEASSLKIKEQHYEIHRSSSAQKLYNLADLEKQSRYLNTTPGAKTYYGQK